MHCRLAVIDTSEKIEQGLAAIGPMINEGLITLNDVEIAKYTHRALPDLPTDRPVREIMTPDPLTVQLQTPRRRDRRVVVERIVQSRAGD